MPVEEIQKALRNMKAVAVMDKSLSFGGDGGAVFHEIRHALYDVEAHPHVVNYVYGLGGRDSSPKELRSIYADLQRIMQTGRVEKTMNYFGLRE